MKLTQPLWPHLAPDTGEQSLVCPHCQTRGAVTRRQMRVKRGISGGKATGAILTGGTSMLLTGLSRKQKVTQAACGNCGSSWTVE